MMSYNYYTLGTNGNPDYGQVESLKDFGDAWMLRKGILIGEEYPKNAHFQFHKTEGNQLTDFVNNINNAFMISQKFKDVIDSFEIPSESLQFLPFTLSDKNGKQFEGSFYIVNPLETVECLDFELIKQACSENKRYKDNPDIFRYDGIQYNSSERTKIINVKYTLVNKEKIPEDMLIFRVKELPELIIIRSDVMQKVSDAGLTGMPIDTASTLDFACYQL